jgi:hypothetical protein
MIFEVKVHHIIVRISGHYMDVYPCFRYFQELDYNYHAKTHSKSYHGRKIMDKRSELILL